MPSPRVRRPAAALSAFVLAGALAGCGSSQDKASDTPTTNPPSTPVQQTATAAPSPAPSPSQPADTTTANTAPPPTSLAGRLLDAAELPGLNAQFTWTNGRTVSADSKPFGLCQKFDFLSIGATDVVERTFKPVQKGGASAAEQIATFPDANNTHRANAVLNSWHDQCASQLTNVSDLNLHPILDVPVTEGTGSWYLVSYVPGQDASGDGEFRATGIVVSGTRIALIRMDNQGQDYNYPAGKEPMVAAVQAAAKKADEVAAPRLAGMTERRHHKPAMPGAMHFEEIEGGPDPSEVREAADRAAAALVRGARDSADAELVTRVVHLADSEGLETLAALWSGAPADSLAGALWRLYLLRSWVYADPQTAAREFDLGRTLAPVAEVISGVSEPPGPDEVRSLVDAVLRGVVVGDFADTLFRAAAFARVTASGRARSEADDGSSYETDLAASRLLTLAEQLEAAARLELENRLG